MNKKKIIGILQPVYLPWLGYFEQMAYVDQFVIMDDVQYTKKDWRNRNQIKTVTGSMWLTVPVRKYQLGTPINQIYINYEERWVVRHLKSIEINYRKSQYFEPLFSDIKSILETEHVKLMDLNVSLIRMLCRYLDIDTPIAFSSAVPRTEWCIPSQMEFNSDTKLEKRNLRIVEICQFYGAAVLYDGKSAANFIDLQIFNNEGIEIVFQDYQHPEYPQLHGGFLPYQSIIDLIMNTGPEAVSIVRSSPYPENLR